MQVMAPIAAPKVHTVPISTPMDGPTTKSVLVVAPSVAAPAIVGVSVGQHLDVVPLVARVPVVHEALDGLVWADAW